MRELKLNAQLRAYSRAPYFTDWIRDLASQESIPDISTLETTIAYVRAYDSTNTPIWTSIDTSLLNQDVINSLIELVKSTQANFDTLANDFDFMKDLISFRLEVTGPYSNQLVFTDAKGEKTAITLPSSYPDNETIGVNNEHLLYVMDKADDETIVVTDIERKDLYNALNEVVGTQKVSGKLRAEKLYVKTENDIPQYISGLDISNQLALINKNITDANKNIDDLEKYVQGKGGFIDPCDFGSTKTLNNEVFDKYYYDLKNNGIVCDIPDQTKVKNLYDGHIWVYVLNDNNWVDEGADVVVTANNEGVLGVVTGSEDQFQISINSDGIMSVNGLEESLNNKLNILHSEDSLDAAYVQGITNGNPKLVNISDSASHPESLVKRTNSGTILSETKGDNPYEVVNLSWLETLFATSSDIENIKPIMGDN